MYAVHTYTHTHTNTLTYPKLYTSKCIIWYLLSVSNTMTECHLPFLLLCTLTYFKAALIWNGDRDRNIFKTGVSGHKQNHNQCLGKFHLLCLASEQSQWNPESHHNWTACWWCYQWPHPSETKAEESQLCDILCMQGLNTFNFWHWDKSCT